MDQLSRDAKAARKAGLSYGRYMDTKQQPKPIVRRSKKKKVEELRCINCNMLIPPACTSNRYCSPECAHAARMKQDNLQRRNNPAEEETTV